MVFLGIDWAEAYHDVCLLDEQGKVLGKRRVIDGLEGVRRLHELVAEHAEEPEQVVVGIEIDRGLLVHALVAAGYQLYAINPLAVSRYRERHGTSGAKSDPADAKLLADLVRTDRHNHRPLAGDSELAEAIKVLARTHQNLVWSRQRQVNQLRSLLREFYPAALEAFGTDLAAADAIAILGAGADSLPGTLHLPSQDHLRTAQGGPGAQPGEQGCRDPDRSPSAAAGGARPAGPRLWPQRRLDDSPAAPDEPGAGRPGAGAGRQF